MFEKQIVAYVDRNAKQLTDTPPMQGRELRYRFSHELLRQTLYETLSLPRRQRLHARVADGIENVYASNLDPHVSALAHHLYQAGSAADRERTILFLSEAATQANRALAFEEALDHLGKAIGMHDGEQPGRTADLFARRAATLVCLSRHPDAILDYERALALLEPLDDHVRYVEICIRLHILRTWAKQFEAAEGLLNRLDRRSQGKHPALRATVLAMRSYNRGVLGNVDEALEFLEELDKISDADLPASVLAFTADREMYVRYGAGQFHLCEAAAQKAIRYYEESGDPWGAASVEMGVLWPPLSCGRPAEAERLVWEAIQRAERAGNNLGKTIELWLLAAVYVAKGQLEDAELTARESLRLMDSYGFGWAFIAELSLGGILLYRGKIEEALSTISRAAARSAPHHRGFGEGLLAWGMTAAVMDGAASAIDQAVPYLPHPKRSRGVGAWHTLLSLTEAWGLSGDRQAAARWLADTEAMAVDWDCSHGGFPVRTAAGIAAACAGDWERAEKHHLAAIARMDAVPYITAQPIARYWYADMLAERRGPGDIEAAIALLQSTITASDSIGLALYAGLARRKYAQLADNQQASKRSSNQKE